jgi:outer membrane cobalamin receptor
MSARAADEDSLRVTQRDSAIVVTALRWTADITGAGPARSVLTREVIDRMSPMSMAATMTLFPGVFVRDYGGLGGLQLVSLRGGSSAQALVMLDGARLSSAQNGSIDLASIPVRTIDRVEVIRGGASALYGANALTGALDVHLRLADTASVSGLLAHGAFNEWRSAVGATLSIGQGARLGVDVDMLGTRGSFPFQTTQFGTAFEVNRQNGDVRHVRGLARLELGDRHAATLILRSADRGVPGAVVQGSITQARARLRDDDLMAIVRSVLFESATDRLTVLTSIRHLDQHFADPDATIIGTQGIDVRYVQRDAMLSAVWRHQKADWLTTLRLDASHADLRGASILTSSGEAVQRRSISAAADAIRLDLFASDVELRMALRADVFSDVGVALSPMIALRRPLAEGLAVRAGWSMSFRPPTFNELYYLNYGTRDLRSERASTFDVGVVAQPWSWCTIDLTAYSAMIRDLIVSVPVSPVLTSAQNVGRVTSQGAELVVRAHGFDGQLLAQWSYTLQLMRDATGRPALDGRLVPYAVPELASALLQWDVGSWFVSAQWSYTGYRYALPGEPRELMLEPFALTSLQAGLRMHGHYLRANVMLQCDNLFDASYQVVRGYPMPGRAMRVIAGVEL